MPHAVNLVLVVGEDRRMVPVTTDTATMETLFRRSGSAGRLSEQLLKAAFGSAVPPIPGQS